MQAAACPRPVRLQPGRRAAAEGQLPPLGLLVSGAAVLPGAERRGAGCLEVTLGANVVGPVALMAALLPAALAGGATLLTVGSFTHLAARAAHLYPCLAALAGGAAPPGHQRTPFRPAARYMASKALATMAALQLAAVAPPGALRSLVVDPGAVDSELVREWPAPLQALFRAGLSCLGLLHPPSVAAAAVVAAAASAPTGSHWAHWRGRLAALPPSQMARSPAEQEAAWDLISRAVASFLAGGGV